MLGSVTGTTSKPVTTSTVKKKAETSGAKSSDAVGTAQKSGEKPAVSDAFSSTDSRVSSDPAGSKAAVSDQADRARTITGENVLQYNNASAETRHDINDPNKQINLFDKQNRIDLIYNTPQINETSKTKGNSGGLCSAASLTNALIMDSKDPEAAKKNAGALRTIFNDFNKGDAEMGVKDRFVKNEFTKLSDKDKESIQTAINNMEKGSLSRKDTEILQQFMYNVSQRAGGTEEGGLNADGMATMAAMIKSKGGFAGGSDIKFHLDNNSTVGGRHWTASVDNVRMDSQPVKNPQPGQARSLLVPTPYSRESNWEADVSIPGGSGNITVNTPANNFSVNSSNYTDTPSYAINAFDELERTRKPAV